jgi:hypothetical protein
MLVMLTLIAILAGAVLGLYFRVLVLVPALAIGSITVLGIEMAYANTLWSIFAATALAATGLQMGYLGGTVIRAATTGAHSGKDAPESVAAGTRLAR